MATRMDVLASHLSAHPQAAPAAGPVRTILLATEKPFAAAAVAALEKVVSAAPGFRLKKLENAGLCLIPKHSRRVLRVLGGSGTADEAAPQLDADALIVRSDLAHKDVFESADKLQIVVRAGAGE
eukprot:gene7886-8510_t